MKYKNWFALLLSVLLLCTLFSGCKEETGKEPVVSGKEESSSEVKPLQVLMEADVGIFHKFKTRKTALTNYASGIGNMPKSFLNVIEELGGPKKKEVSLKFLPLEGIEREQALSQMQTEIMAGGGPDVFVSFAGTALEEPKPKNGIKSASIYMSEETPVIPYPQQAMERGMFLNLDDYLPKAQFMKLENLPEPLAKAGQYEGSQYILPMTYTVPLICFDRAQVEQPEFSKTMTWGEMPDKEYILKTAAAVDEGSFWVGAPLWPLIDDGKLSFTEEELLEFVKRKLELFQDLQNDRSVPISRFMCFGVDLIDNLNLYPEFTDCEIFTAVPTYSKRGGYGALIETYVALNANTERPDDAFFIVDYLLSEECQQSDYYWEITQGASIPSMTGDLVLEGFSREENHKTYCALISNITFAELDTPLNPEIGKIIYQAQQNGGKDIESIVHDGYTRMKMLLDES